MLSDKAIVELKAALLQRLNQLRTDLQAAETDAAPVQLDQQVQGRLSRMDAMQMQAMSQAEQLRRRQQLKDCERAMLRIEQGIYGECEHCGEVIAEERLHFNPAAPLCLDCAAKAEQQ